MDWAYELIGTEIDKFLASEERLNDKLPRSRDYWQRQLDRGRISEQEAEGFNDLLQAVMIHMQASRALIEAVGWLQDTIGGSPQEVKRLKNQVKELEIKLEKYKRCPDERWHPYIKLGDLGLTIDDFRR